MLRSWNDPESSSSESRTLRGLFLATAGVTTAIAPWCLGGQPLKVQWWLLYGAAGTLITGLLVRMLGKSSEPRSFRRIQTICLLLGLSFVAMLYIQASNPSHQVVMEGNLWKLSPIPHTPWAPKSIAAPFDRLPGDFMPYKNAWRFLLIYGTGWLFATGMVLGLKSRQDAIHWLLIVAINGALLAGVCIVHRATRAQKTLWLFTDTFDFTKSPVFFYKNHNGAYLAATMAAVLALAVQKAEGMSRRMWEAVAVLLWVAIVLVNSRVATATATVWGMSYIYLRCKSAAPGGIRLTPRACIIAGIVLCALLAGGLSVSAVNQSLARFRDAFSNPVEFAQGGYFRAIVRHVGLAMWKDRPAFGWGGGSFLYLFNTYHIKVPEVARFMYQQQPQLNRFYDVTANCDWIEGLAEYGAVGMGILSLTVALPLFASLRRWHQAPPGTGFVTAGAVGLLFHAFYDYILRNPAILLLFIGLVISMFKLSISGAAGPDNITSTRKVTTLAAL
jgi:hypothetical protein